MRYYCQNCKSEFKPEGWHEYEGKGDCPFCKVGSLVIKIPDFETPAQYEKRTGEKLSDNAAVWQKSVGEEKILGEWHINYYGVAVEVEINDSSLIVITGPEPPPDDYEMEDEG